MKTRVGIIFLIEAIAKVPFCHPELVSMSHNLLILLDAEINSA